MTRKKLVRFCAAGRAEARDAARLARMMEERISIDGWAMSDLVVLVVKV